MAPFGIILRDLSEDDRLYRNRIKERLLSTPGLFDNDKAREVIDEGLCAPTFKVTKLTLQIDEKIDDLSKVIKDNASGDHDSQKVYQGLLIEMFSYRNDESNSKKFKDFDDVSRNWELDAKICEISNVVSNLKKEKDSLDKDDAFYNMKLKKLEEDIKVQSDSLKRLLTTLYMNNRYMNVVKKQDIEKTVEDCNSASPKDFTKQVNKLRKQRVKNDLVNNRKEAQYRQFLSWNDDTDE